MRMMVCGFSKSIWINSILRVVISARQPKRFFLQGTPTLRDFYGKFSPFVLHILVLWFPYPNFVISFRFLSLPKYSMHPYAKKWIEILQRGPQVVHFGPLIEKIKPEVIRIRRQEWRNNRNHCFRVYRIQ